MKTNSHITFTCKDSSDILLEFSKQLQGYEGITCQCHNCLTFGKGNFSAKVIKRNPWFTFCFVPVLPLSRSGYEDVICSICNFAQPLKNRQDVVALANGGGGIPLQNGPLSGPTPGPQPPGWIGASGGLPPSKPSNTMYG
ncbi:hypothetical protein OnM2_036045 [Erysiphe neolycopersici]|uniref:Uncharacterized protein n=1 Tax=Erysiphe neolycopersici TaxID=212602 RepID=A0A420HXB2_9PEZI|nr:hypothetical protein OnM2_036045 [Erysiphe neolycopersici]